MPLSRNRPLLFVTVLMTCALAVTWIAFHARSQKSDTGKGSLPVSEREDFQRIICATPSVTEIVFALGCGGRVVGVSDFTVYPPETRFLPSIGGLINPNRERITALQPDLVIFQGKHEALARFCREKNIRFLSIPIDALADIPSAIRKIGQELGISSSAERVSREWERSLRKIREKTRGLLPRRVFLTLGHTPGDLTGLMTTGSDTFLHDLIELVGGENIFADAVGSYPQVSKEALMMRQPDIIIEIFAEGLSSANRRQLREDWQRLSQLDAVRSGRIHFLTEDYLLIPGMRISLSARRFAEIIHPEVFDEKSD